MPASISLTIRYAIMGMILVMAYFTVQGQAGSVRKSLMQEKMSKIAAYVDKEMQQGLESVNEYNSTAEIRLHLPLLEEGYKVSLGCQDQRVLVNVSANLPSESSTMRKNLKCSWVNASGKVPPGEQCLVINRQSNTQTNVKLVNDCGA